MGSRKKKKSRCCLMSLFVGQKKRRKSNKASSSTCKRRATRRSNNKDSSSTYKRRATRGSPDPKLFELKDMRKLSSNDEAFHLSCLEICDIIAIIRSRKTPTPNTYMKWDEYAISFYLKMCTCFGVDYQNLEYDDGNRPLLPSVSLKEQVCNGVNQPSTKEMSYEELIEQEEPMECSGVNQLSSKEMSHEERLKQVMNMKIGFVRKAFKGPYKFGSYSSGSTPDRIPYHLYLLVKEAVNIMKRFEWHKSANDLKDLTRVEEKISFFCTFFHTHLPTGWNYDRDNAHTLIAGYDATRKPRYLMGGYTPSFRLSKYHAMQRDDELHLTEGGVAGVMGIIYSRKTPPFWRMRGRHLSLFCKLCSCFGIDYHRVEAASEDDVCLMNMGRDDWFERY